MQPCFDVCDGCAAYTDGAWVPQSRVPPYRLNASIYKPAGLRISAVSPQHYGRCDDVATSVRQLYDWQPSRCSLQPFTIEASCHTLRGKQLLFAGDSTMWQLFLSFVLMHGGQLGRNMVATSAATDLSASVCDDQVRAVFVRSDLLLWSNHHWEYTQARKMDTTVKGGSFLYRAVAADLVLYGLGHHFPRIIDRADKMGAEEQLEARRAFFMRNLNHTLASTIAHRAAAGHHPSTVTLLGATTPVSGCSRYTRPISLTESLASGAEEQPTNQYTHRWQMMPRFNQVATAATHTPQCTAYDLLHATIPCDHSLMNSCYLNSLQPPPTSPPRHTHAAPPPGLAPARSHPNSSPSPHPHPHPHQVARWLAADTGARFLDVAKLSAQRPDAAMARFMPKAGALDEDCEPTRPAEPPPDLHPPTACTWLHPAARGTRHGADRLHPAPCTLHPRPLPLAGLHVCMPGPVDTWVRLLHNLWSRPSMRAAMDASGSRSRPGPFFALNTTRWLGERSAGHSVEQGCSRRAAEPRRRCIDSIVSRHWWWPFANNTRRPKAAKAASAAGKGAKGKRRSKGRRLR